MSMIPHRGVHETQELTPAAMG